jgi:hypothetical protein
MGLQYIFGKLDMSSFHLNLNSNKILPADPNMSKTVQRGLVWQIVQALLFNHLLLLQFLLLLIYLLRCQNTKVIGFPFMLKNTYLSLHHA